MTATGSGSGRTDVERFYEEFSLDAGLRDWLRPNGRHERLKLELDDALGGARDLTILDVGCGGGVMSSHLCRYGEVTGLDLSRSAVRLAGLLEPRARFEPGTVADHRRDGAYDLVTLFDVIEHVPPTERAGFFRELDRVLAPHGWILLSTPHPEYLRWVQTHRPELLQVIDEPIELDEMLRLAAGIGRQLVSYRTYQVDAPGTRQYQLVVLAPPSANGRGLYDASAWDRLLVRVVGVIDRAAPWARRARHAVRLVLAGRPRVAAWMLGVSRRPPVTS